MHGDFAPAQVLGERRGGVRIIDLDRFGHGDPRLDLGSFLATELLAGGTGGLTEALLDGYGRPGVGGELRPWAVHGLLTRLDEPFRSGRADWRAQISVRLALAEVLLR